MIGDWVNVVVKWKPEIKYMYGEVSELLAPDGYLKVRQSYDPYHDNEIYCLCDTEPIPLTPEILEKNGFENRGAQFFCDSIGMIWWKDNIFMFSKYTRHEDLPTENVSINIGYVHELQHALRLCGIEKEIVL